MTRPRIVLGAIACGLGLTLAGCGPSDVESIDLSASKAAAEAKGLSRGGPPPDKPKRTQGAPSAPPERGLGR